MLGARRASPTGSFPSLFRGGRRGEAAFPHAAPAAAEEADSAARSGALVVAVGAAAAEEVDWCAPSGAPAAAAVAEEADLTVRCGAPVVAVGAVAVGAVAAEEACSCARFGAPGAAAVAVAAAEARCSSGSAAEAADSAASPLWGSAGSVDC